MLAGEPARRRMSLALRLFLAAVASSTAILLVAGIALTAIFRSGSERAFDERLGVYVRALVADVASPGEDSRTGPFQLGDPQFELSFSGWYWQITRLDVPNGEVRASRSLFATRLPRLPDDVPVDASGVRAGYIEGPDGRRLREVERAISMLSSAASGARSSE